MAEKWGPKNDRKRWDENAEKLKTYEGLNRFCRDRFYRQRITDLLDNIHHYDTLLYGIVTRKYANSKDAEAKATLKDIEELESDYKTLAFKQFIRDECELSHEIESNFGHEHGSKYEKERGKLEAELEKYVDEITELIDVIDEHVHHLDLE